MHSAQLDLDARGSMRSRWARAFAVCLIAGLALGPLTGCPHTRPDCPSCSEPNPLNAGCPFSPVSPMLPLDGGAQNVLFLSGGASHGAWGAGVLYGWNEAPQSRPDFDLITGISTGALQAPLVFLDMDAELEKLFTTTTTADVYKWRWFPLWSDSLQDRTPLKNMIDEYLDDAVVKQVGEVPDRHLWIGTVNLDTTQFCSWDMVQLAKLANTIELNGDPDKAKCYRDLFRDVVFAASGAPIVASPVEIDANYCEAGGVKNGYFHVDGGTRLRVFAEKPFLDELQANRGAAGEPKAYVIMNGKLQTHPQCVDDRIIPIGERALDIMMSESVFGNLYFLKTEMGDGWELQLSHIPHDYPLFPGQEFDPPEMTLLFDAGRDWVKKTDPWHGIIPPKRVEPCPPGDGTCMCSS